MNKKMILTAALLAAPLTMQPAAAQNSTAHIWDTVPHHLSFCTLTVRSIVQDNSGQPLRFQILNNTRERLQYRIDISAPRADGTRQTGSVSVDNANAGETSTATSGAFSGNLSGQSVRLTLYSCSRR